MHNYTDKIEDVLPTFISETYAFNSPSNIKTFQIQKHSSKFTQMFKYRLPSIKKIVVDKNLYICCLLRSHQWVLCTELLTTVIHAPPIKVFELCGLSKFTKHGNKRWLVLGLILWVRSKNQLWASSWRQRGKNKLF